MARRIDFFDDPNAPAATSVVPSANVVVVNDADEILLIRRTDNDNWALPGGAMDLGESLPNAAIRETAEETGVEVEITGLVGIYRWHYAPKDVTFLRFCFRGSLEGADSTRGLDQEIVSLEWLTVAELKQRRAEHRSPLVERCVEDFLAGRNFPLELLSRQFA